MATARAASAFAFSATLIKWCRLPTAPRRHKRLLTSGIIFSLIAWSPRIYVQFTKRPANNWTSHMPHILLALVCAAATLTITRRKHTEIQ